MRIASAGQKRVSGIGRSWLLVAVPLRRAPYLLAARDFRVLRARLPALEAVHLGREDVAAPRGALPVSGADVAAAPAAATAPSAPRPAVRVVAPAATALFLVPAAAAPAAAAAAAALVPAALLLSAPVTHVEVSFGKTSTRRVCNGGTDAQSGVFLFPTMIAHTIPCFSFACDSFFLGGGGGDPGLRLLFLHPRLKAHTPPRRCLPTNLARTMGGRGGRGGRGNKRKGDDRLLKRDFKKSRDNVWDEKKSPKPDADGAYTPYDKNNKTFEKYYKAQQIVPPEEWDQFMECLRTPLPTSFRINGSGKFAEDVRDMVENKLFSKVGETVSGEEPIAPPKCVRWYPNRLAWQFNYSRQQLRRLPHLEQIHEFVKRANEYGSITRQEVVSMIPAFFLAIEPHHVCLDMCAAPGSKTFQLLEMLHGSLGDNTAIPTGFVIANDVDMKRCNLLTHQTKRVNSPGLLVTNHEAQNFPVIQSPGGRTFPFDCILTDVPCSGDGTMRKAPDIWPRWTVGNGNGLHPLQLKIALRAAQLLKVGGRLVYSTCTFNPIEDEAVVAAMLKDCDGALELLDVSAELPDLRRVPGVRTWEVWDKFGKHDTHDGPEEKNKLHATMFPAYADAAILPLERCMRILPHQDDTGGFFVAVFQKVKETPKTIEPVKKLKGPIVVQTALGVAADNTVTVNFTLRNAFDLRAERELLAANGGKALVPEKELLLTSVRGQGRRGGADAVGGGGNKGGVRFAGGLDAIMPVSDPKVIDTITETYGIDREKLPLHKNAVTRTADSSRPKRLYMLTDGLREFLAADHREQLKVICAGVKIFERQEHKDITDGSAPCDYRLTQDGLHMMLPFVTKQIVRPTLAELKLILERRSLNLADDPDRPDRALFLDPHTIAEVATMKNGSCVFLPRIETAEDRAMLTESASTPEEIAIACWKGKNSVNLLVSKVETDHLLEKFGVDVSKKGGGNPLSTSGMEVN